MLNIDLRGRRALVAGVADDGGFGFAIAKALAEAGASVCVGTWPPALNIFLNLLERGKMDESRRMSDGSMLAFERIYPLDAVFDTYDAMPEELRTSKRYKEVGDCSIDGLAQRLVADFGERPLDILVHSLANGPEVKKPLLETSRGGYLAAVSASAYSLVSMIPIALAARDAYGPADTVFTRIPHFRPASNASRRVSLSSAAFALDIPPP
jgi:enoyl-[acyl-carrier protein] reductase I